MIEQQIRYIAEPYVTWRTTGRRHEVRADTGSSTPTSRKLAKGVWTRGGCTSWYPTRRASTAPYGQASPAVLDADPQASNP